MIKGPKEWSISTRLSLWYGLSILLLLGAFTIITYIEFHQSIHGDFDQHLRHESSLLLPEIVLDGSIPEFSSEGVLRSTAYETTGIYATFVRLLTPEGNVVTRSPNASDLASLGLRPPDVPRERTRSTEWSDSPIRTLYNPLVASDGSLAGWLEVSGVEWAVHQQLDWLIRTYLAGVLISTILAFGGGYVLARRALRPVEAITTAAKEIRASDLGARLPTRFGVSDELTRLAETINELLDRLEESIGREHRFISNATHELMTPMTTLRGELDLARRDVRDDRAMEVLNIALNDIDRMEHIIRSLLTLSRVGQLAHSSRISVDVDALCREHVERFRDRADVNGIRLTATSEGRPLIFADPLHVGTILDNLLDNALKYTQRGGFVRVETSETNRTARVRVLDDGHGFDAETADRIFDRFFRANETEIQREPGSGLGLSIARAIARAYDGEISGRSEGIGRGAEFVVTFPLYRAA